MATTVQVRDRESDRTFNERVFGESELNFLYGTGIGRRLTDGLLSRRILNRVYGWLKRRRGSRGKIPDFVRQFGIDTDEVAKPLDDYASFDEFFTRKLKPDARPIDTDPRHLVSPADGRILVYPSLAGGGALDVKRTRTTLAELTGDSRFSTVFDQAAAVVVRLAPADYHRFHFPDSGVADQPISLGHRLHSVHPIAMAAGAPSLANKRMVTRLESDHFGPMLMIEVGALLVGGIVQTYRPGRVERGAEKGFFHLGASTVIVVGRRRRLCLDDDLIEASAQGVETLVKFGTQIGYRP